MRRLDTIVPAAGAGGRPQPVWRLGSVLKHCLGLSRVERSRIWRLGGATINDRPAARPHLYCYPGDVVTAWYPEDTSAVAPEPETPLHVLFEDPWLLAIDKPAGQLSHPARGEQRGTVANAVAARYPLAGAGAPAPVRPVHRLDRDTSGVLLFAREAKVAASLARQRASGSLTRDYLVLVTGRPAPTGTIDYPLGPDLTHRTRRVALLAATLPVPPNAAAVADRGAFQPARTTYQVIQYGRHGALLAARLHTGRTHQLRAHLAAIGHPLLGDGLYGGPSWPGLHRQALHAWRLRFRHPITGAALEIRAPLPKDLRTTARLL